MEPGKILEALSKFRNGVAATEDMADTVDEKERKRHILTILASPILPDAISTSKTVVKEYGEFFFDKLNEPFEQNNVEQILFAVAAFAYEGAVNGLMLDDSLNKIIYTTFVQSADKTENENIRALSLPRISTLILRDKYIQYARSLSDQRKEIENFASTAAAKVKENVETLIDTDEKLKEYLKKATGLKGELGFLILSKAFTDFIDKKEAEIITLLKALKRMGGLLLAIPILAFIGYQILPLVKHTVPTPSAMQLSYSSVRVTEVGTSQKSPANKVADSKPLIVENNIVWPNIVDRLLNFLPIAVAELILLFYFRIVLFNYNAANAQLLQLRMRQSVCQFIEDYTNFKKDNKIEDLEKFDSLIFSNLMPNADQIPATFEGLEHLGKILGEFKPVKKTR
jgi:hypothetical protein